MGMIIFIAYNLSTNISQIRSTWKHYMRKSGGSKPNVVNINILKFNHIALQNGKFGDWSQI